MKKHEYRRLRRRSPSDSFASMGSSNSKSRQHHLRRSTTIEEIELIRRERGDNDIDLDRCDDEDRRKGLERNDGRSLLSTRALNLNDSQNSSASSSCDESSALEETTSLSSGSDDETQHSSCNAQSVMRASRSSYRGDKSIRRLRRSSSLITGVRQLLESFISEDDTSEMDNTPAGNGADVIENEFLDGDDNLLEVEHQDSRFQKFKAKRYMTATQEKWNALTMIPTPVYCLYYLLSGSWIDSSALEQARESQFEWLSSENAVAFDSSSSYLDTLFGVDPNGCLSSDNSLLRQLTALPPLAVLAVAIGISAHAPFSFLYHWKYAIRPDSLLHWSRRLDQAMIHVASAMMSYATSGNLKYFLLNCLFNLDCCYKQLFDPVVRPLRNQIRVFLSMLLYTLPILRRGDIELFVELWTILSICAWLFARYPLGGWSHSVFHVVATGIPPLLMIAARELPSSQQQIMIAAQCSVRFAGGSGS